MNPKVSHKITYLNLILSIFIMGLHAYDEIDFSASNFILSINQAVVILFNMAVPTFFFISAILFYRNIENRKYIQVLKTKSLTIVVPYLLWNVIFCPFRIIKQIFIEHTAFTMSWGGVILGIFTSYWNPVLWFLRVLFVYFLLFPLFKYIIKHRILCLIVILITSIVTIVIGPTTGYGYGYYWLPVYLLGGYLAVWEKEFLLTEKKFDRKWLYLIFGIVLIGLVVGGLYSPYVLYLCRMCAPILIWMLGDIFLTEKEPYWWARQSFYYYCVHLAIAEFIRKFYIIILGNGMVSTIFSIPIVTFLTTACVVLSAYVLRYIKPLWNILTGMRGKNETRVPNHGTQ